MRISEQTNAEMERGRSIAERNIRSALLTRYIHSGKVISEPCTAGPIIRFRVYGEIVTSQDAFDDDYPSETVMATLALAIGATTGFDGIPAAPATINPEERRRRDEYRQKHVKNWSA